jgi:DNA-binding SARP family transcriptional activator/Tfp pilus assembly protein PilF
VNSASIFLKIFILLFFNLTKWMSLGIIVLWTGLFNLEDDCCLDGRPGRLASEDFCERMAPRTKETFFLALTLEIDLLGHFRLACEGQPVTGVDTPRLQSFLAYVVLNRDVPQLRSQLAFLYWPDSGEDQARTNLRKQLYHLRQALPDADAFLTADNKTLQWRSDAPLDLDVDRFEAAVTRAGRAQEGGDIAQVQAWLERAVEAYGGDLLPASYEDWLLPERERLRQRFIRALEQLAKLLEDQRAYQAAIPYVERLLRTDPLHEASYRRLMRLHALNGDRSRALSTYHTCEAILDRELEVAPAPATRELYQRLLGVGSGPEPSGGRALREDTRREDMPAPVPLVGRKEEWAHLLQAWQAAEQGQPHWALLSGEAGIGKTHLAEELLHWAGRQGIATASARCYASEGELAYGPVAAWLRAKVFGGTLMSLDRVWRSELARLLPELLAGHPGISEPKPLRENWQRQYLFQALAQPFVKQRQLVLLLDDLQWCDQETLSWLSYLLRSPVSPGLEAGQHLAEDALQAWQLLVVATLRPTETAENTRLAALLADLDRRGQSTTIKLGPLDERNAAILAARVTGKALEAELSTRLYHETEGNPLFLIETLRLLQSGAESVPARPDSQRTELNGVPERWPVPAVVRDVISTRLAYLSPTAQELVEVAATIGREFRLDLVRSTLAAGDGVVDGLGGEGALVRALNELVQQRIVRAGGAGAYDFSHDKIREVAYDHLSRVRRQYLHRCVAQALEDVHVEGPDTSSGQIAAHYEASGLPERALPYYRRAADFARRIYANAEAIRYYEHILDSDLAQCLSPLEGCDLMLDLGQVWQLQGNWPAAEAIYREALGKARKAQGPRGMADRGVQARCQQALADVVRLRGAYDEALAWLAEAREGFEAAGELHGVMAVLWTSGEVLWYSGDHAGALAALQKQARIAIDIGDQRRLCDAYGTMGIVYWSQGDAERARAHCLLAIELAGEIGYRWAESRAMITLGNISRVEGNHLEAFAWYQQAFNVAREIGDPQASVWAVANMGNLYTVRGEFDRALACNAYGLHKALELGDRWSASIALANLAGVLMEQAQWQQAEDVYRRAVALGRALGANYLHSYLWGQAKLYARQGRQGEALSRTEEALRLATQPGQALIGGEDIAFEARVLSLRLRSMLAEIEPASAEQELERLLEDCEIVEAPFAREHEAALAYEIWRLNPARRGRRHQAAAVYRSLYERSPQLAYRRRYEELTGEMLPEAPRLPALPGAVQPVDVDLGALLTQADVIFNTSKENPS